MRRHLRQDTRQWLEDIKRRYDHTYPILTPRFTPSCTDELMTELGKIQREYHVPVQSHLSENFGEIAWVKELCPTSRFYGDAYDMFGLFGTKPAFNTNEADFASASGLNTTDNTAAHISSDSASVLPYHHGTLRPLHRRRDPDDQGPGRLRRPLSGVQHRHCFRNRTCPPLS